MKSKALKIIIALIVAAVVFVVGFVLGRNTFSEKELDSSETTTPEITETTTEEETTYTASAETVAKAKEAYKAEIAKYELVNESYSADINGDGIPEVFCRTEGPWEEFMMTYTEKGGLSVVLAERHSSVHPEIYISEDNMVYSYDEGHNGGTAFYRKTVIYEITETGFVEKEVLMGDEPEGIDYTDYEEVFRLSDEYEILFREEIRKATDNRAFEVFSEVSEKENVAEYLNEKLG